MKLLFDFFPILLFFVAFKVWGIYTATAVAIAASFAQVALFWLRHRRFEKMHLAVLGIVAISGGLTLAFQDEMFVKWKPTLVNWLFGVVFIASQYVGEKPLAERMMAASIALPREVWYRLNLSWGLFFLALGAVNVYVLYHFDTDTWVNFKLFGMMGLTFAFVIAQAFYIARHVEAEETDGTS